MEQSVEKIIERNLLEVSRATIRLTPAIELSKPGDRTAASRSSRKS
jgi:hypothetical protein